MSRTFLRLMSCLLFAVATFSASASIAIAQTVKVVPFGDSALLIATQTKCTTACADSILITWKYGERSFARMLKGASVKGGVDTVRVRRPLLPMTATFGVVPFKGTVKAIAIPNLPIDSVFEFASMTSAGFVKHTGAVSIPAGDSIRAVFVIRLANGATLRPTTPVAWSFDSTVLAPRYVTALRDTVWLSGR